MARRVAFSIPKGLRWPLARAGESLKLSVLLTKATTMAKRFFGVPDFHYYAIADGLSALLRSLGRYESRSGPPEAPADSRQAELGLSF